MNAFCPVCRTVVTPDQAVVMGAFGKPWFTVHRGGCQGAVQTVLRDGALVALGALRTALKSRAPQTLRVVEGVATGLRLFRAGAGVPPNG